MIRELKLTNEKELQQLFYALGSYPYDLEYLDKSNRTIGYGIKTLGHHHLYEESFKNFLQGKVFRVGKIKSERPIFRIKASQRNEQHLRSIVELGVAKNLFILDHHHDGDLVIENVRPLSTALRAPDATIYAHQLVYYYLSTLDLGEPLETSYQPRFYRIKIEFCSQKEPSYDLDQGLNLSIRLPLELKVKLETLLNYHGQDLLIPYYHAIYKQNYYRMLINYLQYNLKPLRYVHRFSESLLKKEKLYEKMVADQQKIGFIRFIESLSYDYHSICNLSATELPLSKKLINPLRSRALYYTSATDMVEHLGIERGYSLSENLVLWNLSSSADLDTICRYLEKTYARWEKKSDSLRYAQAREGYNLRVIVCKNLLIVLNHTRSKFIIEFKPYER